MKELEVSSEKGGSELSEREKKLLEVTPEGRVLKFLGKNSVYTIKQLSEEIGLSRQHVGLVLKRLNEAGVTEMEKKSGTIFIEKIQADPKKLRGILEKTSHYKINALLEQEPRIPITNIRDRLHLDFKTLNNNISDLEKAGLIKGVKKRRYKIK